MTAVLGEIVREIAKGTQLTRTEARVVADRILDTLAEGLSGGEKFEIRNFGTFKTRVVSGKVGRHIAEGTSVVLPPSRKVIFKAGKSLKPVTIEESQQGDEGTKGPSDRDNKQDNGEQNDLPGV